MNSQGTENKSEQMDQLDGIRDAFKGITIDLTQVESSVDVDSFSSLLTKSLGEYCIQGIRGVWIRVPREKSHLIPAAVQNGFAFHHCEPEYVMMIRWLPDPALDPNLIPTYPQHFVGCGALVVDWETSEILLITEKRKISDETMMWKIPGGACDNPEEMLGDCARREVLEETGIETELVSVLGFRYMHDYRFGLPDIYFICLLKPLTKEIKSSSEIDQCKWSSLDDYFQLTGLYKVQMQAMDMLKTYMKTQRVLATSDATEFNMPSTMYKVE